MSDKRVPNDFDLGGTPDRSALDKFEDNIKKGLGKRTALSEAMKDDKNKKVVKP